MDIFEFRDQLVGEYERFTRSFVRIQAADLKSHVDTAYANGRFWPAPMVGLNPVTLPSERISKVLVSSPGRHEREVAFHYSVRPSRDTDVVRSWIRRSAKGARER